MFKANVELLSNITLPVLKRKQEGHRGYLSSNQSLLHKIPLPLYETIC